jgi:aryl-alcohol dehydrogenase-like predicted oxidoreductase
MFETYMHDTRFDIIMVRYNAAHRGAEREVFPKLDEATPRPGVVSYTATRWGYLVNPKFTPPGMKTPTAADCYRFALTNPNVDLCLSGPASREQLEANLRALELGPLSDEEMRWMKAVGDHVHRLTARKWYSNPFMQRKQ